MDAFRAWCARSGLELGAGLELREVPQGGGAHPQRKVVRTSPERGPHPPWLVAVPARWIMGNFAARAHLGAAAVDDLVRRGRAAARSDLAEAWPVIVLLASLPERWSAYTGALPDDVPSLAANERISPSDMALLEGTAAHPLVVAAKRDLEELADAAPHMDFGMLAWARSVYWSRAIRLPAGGPHHDRAGLVPLLDMLNHGTEQGAVTQELEWAEDGEEGEEVDRCQGCPGEPRLVLRPGVRFGAGPPGSEVFLFYGAKGNADLAANYGFVSLEVPSDIDTATVMWGGTSWKMENAQHGLAEGLLDAVRAFVGPRRRKTEEATTVAEVYGFEEDLGTSLEAPGKRTRRGDPASPAAAANDDDLTGRDEFLAQLDVEEVVGRSLEEAGPDLIFDISPEYLGEPMLEHGVAGGRETEVAALSAVLDACRMRLVVLHRRRTRRSSTTHAPLDPCIQGVLDAECGVLNSACRTLEILLGFLLRRPA